MRQTLAIFLDAYRELNSKKLFWIVMGISVAVVIALSIPTNNERGVSVFGATLDFPFLSTKAVSAKGFYSFLFSWLGISLWLAWGATILALVSTASIFPDMVSSGSIELTLSRPISRVRFFFTKYATGLLFVGLQAAVFAIGAWLVIGIRGGSWHPRPLMIVPIMVVFFSYLFCICALIGLVTRSTLLSLLGTIIIWLVIWGMTTVEQILFTQRVQQETAVARLESQIKQTKQTLFDVDSHIRRLEESTPTDSSENPSKPDADADAVSETNTSTAAIASGSNADVKSSRPPRRPQQSAIRNMIRTGQAALDAAKSAQDPVALKKSRDGLQRQLQSLEQQVPETTESVASIVKWHRWLYATVTVLPKTGETKNLFERYVVDDKDREGVLAMITKMADDPDARAGQTELNKRSVPWILGTSLAFEGVLLAIGAWLFSRRDF